MGNQISSILEQAKVDAEVPKKGAGRSGRRRRFRVVIHSSPFLRCIQTSIGISSGLAQTAADSIYQPSDVIVPRKAPIGQQSPNKSALLRLDTFLGEWLTPEYFETITPPPGASLMMAGAKSELLRREDYSMYTSTPVASNSRPASRGALWSSPVSTPQPPASPTAERKSGVFVQSAMAAALSSASQEQKKGYAPLRPLHAVSINGKIPDGFVAHARELCTVIDYQWDSMRAPLDFGDGGKLGEEWASMHHRFRSGLRKMVNWYATTDYPDEMLCGFTNNDGDHSCNDSGYGEDEDEEIETVVIIVSHGAGCNALIGAVTHQPVLMDVGIASITVAARKADADYSQALAAAADGQGGATSPLAAVDDLYDIRLSASTEHLRSNSGASITGQPASPRNSWGGSGRRGRGSILASPTTTGGPVQSPFTGLAYGNRGTSANASVGNFTRRDSGSSRQSPKVAPPAGTMLKTSGDNESGATGWTTGRTTGRGSTSSSSGLWAPARSALRFIDDVDEEAVDDYDSLLPDFDNKRFAPISNENVKPASTETKSTPFPALKETKSEPFSFLDRAAERPPSSKRPVFAAPITINTELASKGIGSPVEEMPLSQLGGLWSLAVPEPNVAPDWSQTKRRWTVNERA